MLVRWMMVAAALLAVGAAGCEREKEAAAAPVGLEPGMRPPPLSGVGADGATASLETGGGVRVVVFMRGGGCGLCRLQWGRHREHAAAYRELGAEPIVVLPAGSLPFDSAADAPRLIFAEPDVLKRWAVLDSAGVVLPTAVIIGEDGVIRYRRVGRNGGDRPSDAELLALVAASASSTDRK